ncbi:hypothetical protein SIID45300_02685 [Candidatus Magnetaquicoccaceae bacterium FCR-1]|uniref:Glycosyltransferase subfamily 4-like N-terminal domain-containing protein n=1 Tax=Candidatus Magnetaquiglobus chichijimensis TaxID=3141448 RepID=A0ABQ0CBT0_9PROT
MISPLTKKIMIVSGSFPPMRCGVGDYTFELTRALTRLGVDVSVLTSSDSVSANTELQVYPIIKAWDFIGFQKALRFIRATCPDIVHFQYPTMGYHNSYWPYLLPLFVKLLGIKVVQTWHEAPTRIRYIPSSFAFDNLIFVDSSIPPRILWYYKIILSLGSAPDRIPIGSSIPISYLSDGERSAIRDALQTGEKRLIVYFGFCYMEKGVHCLFDTLDPKRDKLILLTELSPSGNAYHRRIQQLVESKEWGDNVHVTGHLEGSEVAKLLASADAIILPFLTGVKERNGSLLAAKSQGTFTVTTSSSIQGYDEKSNVYYCNPGNYSEIRNALDLYCGYRVPPNTENIPTWESIAKSHIVTYQK